MYPCIGLLSLCAVWTLWGAKFGVTGVDFRQTHSWTLRLKGSMKPGVEVYPFLEGRFAGLQQCIYSCSWFLVSMS